MWKLKKQYKSGVILEGDLGEKVSLSWLTSLSSAEGEVKMYRMYKEIQNLDQNFSQKSWNCCKTSPSLKAPGWPLTNDLYFLGHSIKLLKYTTDCHKWQKNTFFCMRGHCVCSSFMLYYQLMVSSGVWDYKHNSKILVGLTTMNICLMNCKILVNKMSPMVHREPVYILSNLWPALWVDC